MVLALALARITHAPPFELSVSVWPVPEASAALPTAMQSVELKHDTALRSFSKRSSLGVVSIDHADPLQFSTRL